MAKQKPQPEILDWAQLAIRRHDATVAMLAALKMAHRMSRPNGARLSADRRQQLHNTVDAAITQAETAGIKIP